MQLGSLGLPELLVILLVVLLLFGPKRLPEVARGLGKAVKDFRKGLESGLEEVEASTRPAPAKPAATESADGHGQVPAEPAAVPTSAPEANVGEPPQDPPAKAA